MSKKVKGLTVKLLLILAVAVIVLVAASSFYWYQFSKPSTLSAKELHSTGSTPYKSDALSGSNSLDQVRRNEPFDAKRCTPKALRLGKTAREIHLRTGEKLTRIPVVAIQILESGDVANVVLKRSSGVRDADNIAIDWVKGSTYNNRPGCGIVESEVGVTIDF